LGLAEAEFPFLYDPKRKLLAIGYWVTERRLDNSSYDLLASEARLASYVAIASGQLPSNTGSLSAAPDPGARQAGAAELERLDVRVPDAAAGDASSPGTLLDQTCNAAVARQIEYGRQCGVPWGVSESCYNLTDVEGTYQYRAFGSPAWVCSAGSARRW